MAPSDDDALTTISLRKDTRDRLRRLGRKGETYDIVLNRMMDALAGLPAARPRAPVQLVDFEAVEGGDES